MCQFPSVFHFLSSLLSSLFSPTYASFISYLYIIYECWYHSSGDPVISGEVHIRWSDTWSWLLLILDIREAYEEVLKIYRLISYRLEFTLYPILFLIILKNIIQHWQQVIPSSVIDILCQPIRELSTSECYHPYRSTGSNYIQKCSFQDNYMNYISFSFFQELFLV